MPPTTPERYAVVSCHVERPLDDRVWGAFSALQERRPGGLVIAGLLRPPDPDAGETDDDLWVSRAREAAARGPLGHHTHFTSPTHARPTGGGTGARVRREGAWIRERGLMPSLFCGGGWYTDQAVALACAELGYADCTARATRPPYLADGAAWAELDTPARIDLGERVLVAVPTTHGAGDLARALVRPELPLQIHAYFHDTDLVDRARRTMIAAALALLGRRRPPFELDAVAASVSGPVRPWSGVARGGAAEPRA
ncbi:MAG TPA: hypothetical protein VFJ60_12145 [Gaiella sp.]|nr:hypothetical protein [Gaiella sp.]